MRGDAVIAFEEILDHQLPVGIGRVAAGVGDAGGVDALVRKDRSHIAKGRIEISRFALAHVDEDQPVEHPDVAGEQAILGLVEIFRHQPRRDEPPVEAKGPGVVRAHQPGGIAAFGLTNG